jgi:hypothetical protein
MYLFLFSSRRRLVLLSFYWQTSEAPSRRVGVSLKFGRSCICRLVMGSMGRVIDHGACWGSSLGRGPRNLVSSRSINYHPQLADIVWCLSSF